jgi:hypothetical protein
MRSDKQKSQAQQKEGGKRERKDLEDRRQPRAASRQDQEPRESGQGPVRRRDEKTGQTIH